MKKILNNQHGVTLIETVVSAAIITIILVTVLGALLYGQKMIVFTDTKNNAAAIGQEQIDEIMAKITSGNIPTSGTVTVDGHNVNLLLNVVDKDTIKEGYDIKVQVYYNNNQSYVELKAYAKKGGVGAGL
ncbi:MAG: type II secretion system protein [Eubacteriaceae bacterium]|nr:type II secretion system protein [Eubacteriaceae bacterium]